MKKHIHFGNEGEEEINVENLIFDIPAKLLDQSSGIPSNISWEINSINSLKNNIVSLHGVSSRKRWST